MQENNECRKVLNSARNKTEKNSTEDCKTISKLVCVNTSKQITFFPQESVTDNWLVSVLSFRQQENLQSRNVLLNMLTNTVCRSDE